MSSQIVLVIPSRVSLRACYKQVLLTIVPFSFNKTLHTSFGSLFDLKMFRHNQYCTNSSTVSINTSVNLKPKGPKLIITIKMLYPVGTFTIVQVTFQCSSPCCINTNMVKVSHCLCNNCP